MNIIIDIGNSLCKYAVVDETGRVVELVNSVDPQREIVEELLIRYPMICRGALATVRCECTAFSDYLRCRLDYFIEVATQTLMPIENCYSTPETLGVDRLLASLGAIEHFPKKNILLFDLGSAITIDFVSKDRKFLGGNISPGLNIRFKALNTFTKKLPLVNCDGDVSFVGDSTQQALRNGVVKGIIYEIEGYIDEFIKKNEEFVIIFTGGDAKYFENKVKNTIFVNSNLLVEGLNKVLEYNYAYNK